MDFVKGCDPKESEKFKIALKYLMDPRRIDKPFRDKVIRLTQKDINMDMDDIKRACHQAERYKHRDVPLLCFAVQFELFKLANVLLALNDIDPNVQTREGETPFRILDDKLYDKFINRTNDFESYKNEVINLFKKLKIRGAHPQIHDINNRYRAIPISLNMDPKQISSYKAQFDKYFEDDSEVTNEYYDADNSYSIFKNIICNYLADLEEESKELSSVLLKKNPDGDNSLLYALRTGHLKAFELIWENCKDYDKKIFVKSSDDFGYNALHIAIANTVKPHALNTAENTAYYEEEPYDIDHWIKIIKVLIAAHVPYNAVNVFGETPLDLIPADNNLRQLFFTNKRPKR